MPRVARRSVGGVIYHVLNRANARRPLFRSEADYQAFVAVLAEALGRWPGVKLFCFCIMPNHWHLVLQPTGDGELSLFMRWLTQTHTQRWRRAKRTVGYGALYQGRFKSFPVEEDRHFLILCRYVERNASRAKLTRRAETWRWSSAFTRSHAEEKLATLLAGWPVDRPSNWSALLNEPQNERDQSCVQASMTRSRPLGDERWVEQIAGKLQLTHTLRPPGRPRGAKDGQQRQRVTRRKSHEEDKC